jgi:transcriptional regulator with XRE-family HTH domain
MNNINRSLRLIREFHRLKQNELAEKLKLSASHLSEIESGIKTPSLELINKYSEIFDIPASSILLFAEAQTDGAHDLNDIRGRIADKALKMLEWIAMTKNA